ncbi:MAG TPA: polysaccharide deacetylase family protein [Rectinemataceae bacterium]
MYKPSVAFYKRLIVSTLAGLVLIPSCLAAYLFFQNREMKAKLESPPLPDDLVTVSASHLEPIEPPGGRKALSYQLLHPEFKTVFAGFDAEEPDPKTVYLSFDDGPSTGTPALLDVLARHGVSAAFFVNGKSNRYLADQLKRISDQGHELGMHSYSHRYKILYASMENLLDDFSRNFQFIKAETGKAPDILRFPGGSINIFNVASYQQMISEMLRRGFMYYDWNVSAGDTAKDASAQAITANIVSGVRLCWGPAIVLMHDNGNPVLPQALDAAITILKAEGYVFATLKSGVRPLMFVYPD